MKKIISLENLIYVTIIFLPSYLWKITIFGFPSNALEILISADFFIWFVFYAKKKREKVFFKKKTKKLFLAGGAIFGGLIVSMLVNRNYLVGLGIIKAWFIFPIIFLGLVTSVIDFDRRKNSLIAYFYSAFFVAIISLGYFFRGKMTYDFRLAGIFNSPNYLAMYLAPAFFVAYYLIWPKTRRCFRIILVGLILVLFGAIYLTYSYAAWLALFLAFLVLFVMEKKAFLGKVFLAFLMIISLFFFQQGKAKFIDLLKDNLRSSSASRLMIWRSAEKILKENWFWGIGAGNFEKKYLEYQKYFSAYLEWAVPHPHNLYFAFWLYSGIFGFLGFIFLLIFWFMSISINQKNSELKLAGMGIMLYILFHGVVDTTYFKNDLAIIFWLLFSLI